MAIRDGALLVSFLLLWVLIQLTLFVKFGVRTSVDSELYMADAMNLLDGKLPEGRSIWYVSYSSFLALTFFCGGDNTTVVFIQILLSGIATYCLYELGMKIFNNKEVAIFTILFYLLWIKIHEWNTLLYTESLFTSCSIISFTILVKSKTTWQYAVAGLLLVFTFFIRPTGFSFVIGLLCYGMFSAQKSYPKKIVAPICFASVIGTLLLLTKMLSDYSIVESYAKAEVIYPNITLGIEVPSNLFLPESNYSTASRVLQFAIYNPFYFLKLFFLKLLLFLGNVKPYFSTLHNSMIVLILYPLYFFAIKGFLKLPTNRNEKYFITGFVIAQALTVALTTENWDGRFLVPLLPFIFLLSAFGINHRNL